MPDEKYPNTKKGAPMNHRKIVTIITGLTIAHTLNAMHSRQPMARVQRSMPGNAYGNTQVHWAHQTPITPTNISASTGYTISSEGAYYLTKNIDFNPSAHNIPAIDVQVDNVVIELNGKTIHQSTSNTQTGIDGIQIDTGIDNVVIKNGTIRSLFGAGIYLSGNNKNIRLENVNIDGCMEGGVFCNGSSGNSIDELTMRNCLITSCTGLSGVNSSNAYGLYLKYVNSSLFDGCVISGNDTTATLLDSKSGYGIYLETAKANNFYDCELSSNGGDTAYGIAVTATSAGNTFKKCVVRNTRADLSYGAYVSASDGNTFEDCQFISNVATTTVHGLHLLNAEGTEVLHCMSLRNTSTSGGSAYGFSADSGQGNRFKSCEANANKAAGAYWGTGIAFFTNETVSTISDCSLQANDGGSAGSDIGYGIQIGHANNAIRPTLCHIVNNKLIGNTGSTNYGLYDHSTDTTNMILKNLAFGQGANNFNVTMNDAGEALPRVVINIGDIAGVASVLSVPGLDIADNIDVRTTS